MYLLPEPGQLLLVVHPPHMPLWPHHWQLTTNDLLDHVARTAIHGSVIYLVTSGFLKKALSSDPVLHGLDYSKESVIQTYALDVGIVAVLCQLDAIEGQYPFAFFSRKVCQWENNYSAVEKVCLAVEEGVRYFSVNVTGVPFMITTDHNC